MATYWPLTIPDHGPDAPRHSLWQTVKTWYFRARERQALAELDEHLLRDCGITREQVRAELDKPFWVR